LDTDILKESILNNAAQISMPCSKSLAITCLDQCGKEVKWVEDGGIMQGSKEVFISKLLKALNFNSYYTSMGPTRTTLEKHKI
jgi:hypothetical protein